MKKNICILMHVIIILFIVFIGFYAYKKYSYYNDYFNPEIRFVIGETYSTVDNITMNAPKFGGFFSHEYGMPSIMENTIMAIVHSTDEIRNELKNYKSGHIDTKYEEIDGNTVITYYGDLIDKNDNSIMFEKVYEFRYVIDSDNFSVEIE